MLLPSWLTDLGIAGVLAPFTILEDMEKPYVLNIHTYAYNHIQKHGTMIKGSLGFRHLRIHHLVSF